MSTLEVACGQCDRRFRVRAEFAGRSTRCPGCSAPITVAGAAAPPPARSPEPEDRPRAKSRLRDTDDEPRRPTADWAPVELAFRREQVAVVCVLVGIVLDYFLFCLMRAATAGGGSGGDGLIALTLIVLVLPAVAAGAFGFMARLSALKVPPESLAKGSATASLLCALAGLGCLVMLAITLLMSLDQNQPGEAPLVVALGGLVLSVLGAAATFFGFTSQVGIVRRSAAISAAVARTAVAVSACVLGLIGIGVVYALGSEMTAPAYRGGPFGGGYYESHEIFYQIVLGVLLPLALAVVLILYHRLLAAGRRALEGERTGRDDG